jgi:hypothetical protein
MESLPVVSPRWVVVGDGGGIHGDNEVAVAGGDLPGVASRHFGGGPH